jgi:hypothetical protein
VMLAAATAPTLTLTPAEARRITRRCRAPAEWIEVRARSKVRFLPPANASYKKVDCVLRGLRKHMSQIEFIGNEVPG